jgi:CRISPR-associated protein Csx10
MPIYTVEATLLTPCCISEQPAIGNEVETLDYIPGSALRGMLADLYLRSRGAANNDFRNVFCSDDVSFPNLYPTHCYPLPLSAYTCKRHPGFKNEDNQDGDNLNQGVWNLLFEDFPAFSGSARNRQHKDICDGPLKPQIGWYDRGQSAPTSGSPLDRLLATRTAIHPKSGSALDGSLHSQQELAAASTFNGFLLSSAGHDNLLNAIITHLGGLGTSIIAYTGRRRAGQLKIEIQPSPHATNAPFFFNGWQQGNDPCYFTLTFTSDVILIDHLLRPIISLDSQTLKNEMQFPVDVCVEKAFVSSRRITGWNAVAQIFKPDDVAMARGSSFLLKIKESDKPKVEAWMDEITQTGIGLRRAEGFGRVSFAEPFHKLAAEQKGGPL